MNSRKLPSRNVVYFKDLFGPTEPSESERAYKAVLALHDFASQLKSLEAAIGFGDYGYSIGLQSHPASSEWLASHRYRLSSHLSLLLESSNHFVRVECRKAPAISATAPPNWEKTDTHTWIFSPTIDVNIIVRLLPRDTIKLHAIVGSV